ncbi:peptidase C39-like protein [Mycobacterium sp. BK086]|uniref:C39 family peptidase n=1 Tax=Mycobacterium sp. BK086 TaxID=2512165 RepID=UPI00105DEC58|nr:C39 family peptidase [Mycobacterium sp. BK086]TDO18114.1 peptidase C39-like protein [Mycobacterium sp. BK086]
MTEKVLAFDHGIIPQEKGWDCGPAATQVVLNAVGIVVTETQLIAEIGTTTNGTDDVSWIENRCLDVRLPDANYTTVYVRNDPPSAAQIETYWRNLKQSIDTGHGVINNWVSPATNPPRGIKGSQSPDGYGRYTIYHYVSAVGYDDNYDGRGGRAVCIADSGFRPFFYWVTLEQCVGLISPKGYCYANTSGEAAPVHVPEPNDLNAKDRHALDVIQEGHRRLITPRGIQIALATCYVESNFIIYANAKVPDSMTNPLREAVGADGFSVGIFQQQVVHGANGWWWGDAATCMDPTLSAGLFYDRLARLNYNGPNSPGSYAQAVQSSAFPDRYDTRMGDAEQLYNRLAELENHMALQTSRSIYRTSNDRTMSGDDASFGADATSHMNWVETNAIRGALWALLLVKATANGGVGATKWWEVNDGNPNPGIDPWAVEQATSVLNYILAVNPTALQNAIGKAA